MQQLLKPQTIWQIRTKTKTSAWSARMNYDDGMNRWKKCQKWNEWETSREIKPVSLSRRHHRHCLPRGCDGCGALPIPATGGTLTICCAISQLDGMKMKRQSQRGHCSPLAQGWDTAVSNCQMYFRENIFFFYYLGIIALALSSISTTTFRSATLPGSGKQDKAREESLRTQSEGIVESVGQIWACGNLSVMTEVVQRCLGEWQRHAKAFGLCKHNIEIRTRTSYISLLLSLYCTHPTFFLLLVSHKESPGTGMCPCDWEPACKSHYQQWKWRRAQLILVLFKGCL